MSSKTRPVKVHNAAFLLERLAADCAPLQEYRELTQNAIEAIRARPDRQGQVIWDVDWRLVESRGVYKLCVIDSGVGMGPEELQGYINDLSHSGSLQGLDKNFGVGAKITAGVRNPCGLAYFSWKEDRGAAIQFWRDPDSLVYGLRQFEGPEGTFAHWRPIGNDLKPDAITSTGTMVVLLGGSEGENTALCPAGSPYPSHWLARYLNTRYFRFPEGVRVRVREFGRREPVEWPRTPTGAMAEGSQLREVHGQSAFLERGAQAFGQVVLEDATVRWWLLRDEDKLRDQRHFFNASGHVAAIFQDEIYEPKTGAAGQRMLQQFGILFGSSRVVLYVEPTPKVGTLGANTARSTLLVDGQRLPWDRWAERFRERMPSEIQEMMNAILDGADTRSHREAIRQRLQSVRELYQLPRYRRTNGGSVCTEGAAGGLPGERGDAGNRGNSPSGCPGGRRRDDLYGDILRPDGDPAQPIRPAIVEPQTQWIRLADRTREPGQLEDRAARYLRDQHELLINGDFRVFEDMIRRWTKRYADIPGAPEIVRDVVREWFEQQLVEAVMGVRSLRGSAEWSDDDLAVATSEEALSSVVLPRWNVHQQIGRALARKLGAGLEAAAYVWALLRRHQAPNRAPGTLSAYWASTQHSQFRGRRHHDSARPGTCLRE